MIRAIISLLATIFTGVQIYLLSRGEQAICFNDGCAVVDALTRVSPLWFNIAGFCFFLTLFWLFLQGRRRSEHLLKVARLILLAALASEAVLVYFQYAVAKVFCSYCLIIFAIVVLLNLCCGLRQILRGAVIFIAVSITCLGLQFTAPSSGKSLDLDSGSMAVLPGAGNPVKLYFFFSASCRHCEKVMASLTENPTCNLRFNPIERIESLKIDKAKRLENYDPSVNLAFLRGLSIQEVPLLFVAGGEEMRILKGEKNITEYLNSVCRAPQTQAPNISQGLPGKGFAIPGMAGGGQDSCSVASDCPPGDEPSQSPAQ